ncbi:MAG: hypothetical protein KGL11_13895 [Alphaproteobacteria bacterium]|nr:hypothetical protein [Alphaproteobacteria bacterium]
MAGRNNPGIAVIHRSSSVAALLPMAAVQQCGQRLAPAGDLASAPRLSLERTPVEVR